ncbi:MAG TPA: hypothetical protein VF668_11565 [Pyrinomonadaceae bacterium]|jgi:hypothetical protein
MREREDVHLADDEPKFLAGIHPGDLSADEKRQFERMVEVVSWNGEGVVVRRNRDYRVGRISLGRLTVTIPPPFDHALFVDFYLYAASGDLSAFAHRRTAPVDLDRPGREDIFLSLLARVFVDYTERILSLGVARAYRYEVERARLVRGRPLWAKNFGHHPATGITCGYYSLSTDNLLNRLILSGLVAATRILYKEAELSRLHSQVFAWRSIAGETHPSLADFIRSERQINRLTEVYRPALSIARALILGFSPVSLFAGAATGMQSLEFSLPALFEHFVTRLVRQGCEELRLDVRAQFRDTNAITDGLGKPYRQVKPDLIVLRAGKPVAIIDAKFKPRYVADLPGASVPKANRVSNADIYQLSFYQARLQALHRLAAPPPALIVAPKVTGDEPPDVARRTIRWSATKEDHKMYGLTVLPLPIDKVVGALKDGRSGMEALRPAEELYSFLKAL